MGIFDKVKDAVSEDNVDTGKTLVNDHEAQVDEGVERAGDMVDQRTGDRYDDRVDQGEKLLESRTGSL